LLDDKLHLAPLSDDITHVLDVGTGTGIWAIEFAAHHPSCEITGTDLSSIQPSWGPPNVRFVIDDAEEQWVFNQKFDYVHVRVMIVSIRDWARFIRQGFE
jgi:ubiquinone/menaquinone biosynthesis C-methylase UbiE